MKRLNMWIASSEVMVAMVASLALLSAAAGPCQAALSDCLDATCRLTAPDGSCGSGCVMEISEGSVYIITAAHVVAGTDSVACEFWRHGHQSRRWPAACWPAPARPTLPSWPCRKPRWAACSPASSPCAHPRK